MAKNRKKTDQAKSAGNAEEMAADPTANPNPAQIHSFSRTIAKEHGEKAAVLLQYLAHHVSKSKHVHGGKKWFYKTLDDLAVVFPYLKRSTIHATLQKLSQPRSVRRSGLGFLTVTGADSYNNRHLILGEPEWYF